MARTTIGVSSFSSSYFGGANVRTNTSSSSFSFSFSLQQNKATKLLTSYGTAIACSAVQESSSSSSSATAATVATPNKEEAKTAPKAAPAGKAKPKPAKAPAKPLPEMMQEDIIPSLKTILEAQQNISQINLSFQNNKLEGSFEKEGCAYTFWAFFPDGSVTGAKGFSLSSYGSEASTVEPFLVDEKKITAKHVVFWVEKRLAAQGIIPVYDQ